jgi:hypothetical protein
MMGGGGVVVWDEVKTGTRVKIKKVMNRKRPQGSGGIKKRETIDFICEV